MKKENPSDPEDSYKALVLRALRIAGKNTFFNVNEGITKRLIISQYHQYKQLSGVSLADVRLNIDASISSNKLSSVIRKLVKEGVVIAIKNGSCNMYFLADVKYLED